MDSYILMNGLCNQSVDCVSKEIRNLEECAWKKELGASLELIKKIKYFSKWFMETVP